MGFWTRVRLSSIPFKFVRKSMAESNPLGSDSRLFHFYLAKRYVMDEKKFIVDQYLFETEEEYELALNEKKKIQYIDEHTDYRAVENIAILYMKIIENNMFQTPVGYAYLERLREFLVKNGAKTDNLPSIPVKKKISLAGKKELMRENRQLKEQLQRGKNRNLVMVFVCIGLVVAIIALFALAFTDNHPNILNYENVIQNKYSAWEQELVERENAVREKELALEVDE